MEPLTGQALLDKVSTLRKDPANTVTVQVLACGYIRTNGKPAYTRFYEALLEAKGGPLFNPEPEPEHSELWETLAENYPEEALQAFCDYWSEDDLRYFTDAYKGQYDSGSQYARENLGHYLENLPIEVSIDWDRTWDNLSDEIIELEGFYFLRDW